MNVQSRSGAGAVNISGTAAAVLLATIAILLMSVIPSFFLAGAGGTGTRVVYDYTIEKDGEGDGADLCLAGHRFYNVSLEFTDVPYSTLEFINISMTSLEAPYTSIPTISYNLFIDDLSVITEVEMEVKDPVIARNATGLEGFSFSVLFDLNWSKEVKFKLVPTLDWGPGPQMVRTGRELIVSVYGILDKPSIGMIKGPTGVPLTEGSPIGMNSSVRLDGVTFHYWHATIDVSDKVPMPDQVRPVLVDSHRTYEPQSESVLSFLATSPDEPTGTWTLRMSLPGVMKDWSYRSDLWSFELQLDGYGPTFELYAPSTKVGSGEVEWTLKVSEYPQRLNGLVNGSSLEFRVLDGDNWSDWTSAPLADDGKVITVNGMASILNPGQNRIQFRALDHLGNGRSSEEFGIQVNFPPELSVPEEYIGLNLTKDVPLQLDGFNLTRDPDDNRSLLVYVWFFDGTEIGRGHSIVKPLFSENTGEHILTLNVSDADSSSEISFAMYVRDPDVPNDEWTISDLFEDRMVVMIAAVVIAIVAIIIIAAFVILLARKMGGGHEDDDFIISEGMSRDNEELTQRLKEMYGGNFTVTDTDGSAFAKEDTSGDEFDFDYDLYEVLGLDHGSSEDQIKRTYRKMAAYYHPDRVAMHKEVDELEAREKMVRINKAKEFLLNPERKARYDEHMKELDFSVDL